MKLVILNINKSTFSLFLGLLPIGSAVIGAYLVGTGWANTIKDMNAAVNSFFISNKMKI
jgi:hypothetical protein